MGTITNQREHIPRAYERVTTSGTKSRKVAAPLLHTVASEEAGGWANPAWLWLRDYGARECPGGTHQNTSVQHAKRGVLSVQALFPVYSLSGNERMGLCPVFLQKGAY